MSPASAGLLDRFDNLDQIKVEDVIRWLNPAPHQIALENYIANRILYPQTIPMQDCDMKTELAILREALRLNGLPVSREKSEFLGNSPFINTTMRKIIIPGSFLQFVPDLGTLVAAFIDGLLLSRSKKDCFEDLWTIVLSDETDETIGSIFFPQFQSAYGFMEVKLETRISTVKAGTIVVLPCPKDRCSIDFSLKQGKLLGKSKSVIEVYGGRIGLVIDGRIW